MKAKDLIIGLLLLTLLGACSGGNEIREEFIRVEDGQFIKQGKPYYFVGTNYWYGSLLGAYDKERLVRELDQMKAVGIDNLRIMVGAEGDGEVAHRVVPALQKKQGVYTQELLTGLDVLLDEMKKRDMYAVLYLTNNWIWSGGMSQYLNWNGYGTIPDPFEEEYSWNDYGAYTSRFHSCEPCKEALRKHIAFIISRTNSVNKMKYTEDPTIMSWQVCNEPRPFTGENKGNFSQWLAETVALIDSLAPLQLVSTGNEGAAGCLEDAKLFETTHSNPKVDYLTMHIWAKNWSWYDSANEAASTQTSVENMLDYVATHITIAEKLDKPIVLSEFGFPRNKEALTLSSSTQYRDIYYKQAFAELVKSKNNQGHFAGCNFWGYGGEAEYDAETGVWKENDDFTGDPPQEPQGLNSVFSTDTSTLEIIKRHNVELQKEG